MIASLAAAACAYSIPNDVRVRTIIGKQGYKWLDTVTTDPDSAQSAGGAFYTRDRDDKRVTFVTTIYVSTGAVYLIHAEVVRDGCKGPWRLTVWRVKKVDELPAPPVIA